MFIPDPRVQRVRRSDSFYSIAPVPPPKDNLSSSSIGLKRAPSYGALAQGAKQEHTRGLTHVRSPSGSYPSSDEEEKIRTTRAKKIKTKTGAVASVVPTSSSPPSSTPSSPRGPDTVPSTPAAKTPTSPVKDRASKPKSTKVVADREERSRTPKSPTPTNRPSNKIDVSKKEKESRPLAMNLQRNPSMLGPELPHLCSTKEKKESRSPMMNLQRNPSVLAPELPRLRNTAKHLSSTPYGGTVTPTRIRSPSPAVLTAPPPVVATIQVLNVPESPTPSKVKTLRRVRRLAPARRISFGSLIPGGEADADGEGEAREASRGLSGCLDSAFQLM